MKHLPRRLCSALVTVLAGAVLAAPISGMPASSAAGDPSRPGSVPLTDAAHEPFHTGDAAAANLGDRVVFRAATPAMVQELRITDGTSAGPRLLADMWPGAEDGFPKHFHQLRRAGVLRCH